MEKLLQKQMQFGSWRLIKRLGAGGNGVVWQAEHNDGSLGAIKFLKNWNETPYQRFKDEDRIMRSCKGIQGVLPLLDSHLPARPSSNDRPWIVTALAEQINRKNKLATLENVVRLCESLAETLAESADVLIGISNRITFCSLRADTAFVILDLPTRRRKLRLQ